MKSKDGRVLRLRKWLRRTDSEFTQAVESGDLEKADLLRRRRLLLSSRLERLGACDPWPTERPAR
jgi:hypothetical protein